MSLKYEPASEPLHEGVEARASEREWLRLQVRSQFENE